MPTSLLRAKADEDHLHAQGCAAHLPKVLLHELRADNADESGCCVMRYRLCQHCLPCSIQHARSYKPMTEDWIHQVNSVLGEGNIGPVCRELVVLKPQVRTLAK